MVFSSLKFIFIFMPIFFLCYYLVPNRHKNSILLVGSFCFYFIGALEHPEYFILFLLTILLDFFLGIGMEHFEKGKMFLLLFGVGFHILSLFTVKYLGFVLGEVARWIPAWNFSVSCVLPLGISFYTFQGMSYIMDVYRGKIRAEEKLEDYAVYISMFPQLIAGPIVTYSQVEENLHHRSIRLSMVLHGLGTLIFGMGLKVLLANPLGKLWGQVCAIGYESISTPLAWMAIIGYSMELYLDFFGYSLMAIGLGEMLGFTLPENFRHPYMSLTMTEFWRRWHITLGFWFREYVYIPLGGNRRGTFATIRNLFLVWLLTGIWHGAGYHFILWGLVLFVLIVLEKYWIGKLFNRVHVLGHVYMILCIPLTWAIFAIDDMKKLGIFFQRLFPFYGQGVWSVFKNDYIKYWNMYYPFLLIGLLFCTQLPYRLLQKIKQPVIMTLLITMIFAACVYCMYRGLDDPFLYFRF